MAATFELTLNATAGPAGRYVSWAPSPASLRVLDADGAVAPIRVRLRSQAGRGGRVVFAAQRSAEAGDQLILDLPVDGSPVPFWVLGRFKFPSRADGDAAIVVLPATGTQPLATFALMVRIRKNADSLTAAERDRFLSALARLNNQGNGLFQTFRDVHRSETTDEAHSRDAFMPWHRAYLLDLERELQRLDPSVTLPYWRFDQPSRRLFTAGFMGAVNAANGSVVFADSNPLLTFATDGQIGVNRWPFFNPPQSAAADFTRRAVTSERVTTESKVAYAELRPVFEGNPHGQAHISFGGYISQIGTAARDPLFFLLHCNVDRLWAKWQWLQQRFDVSAVQAYRFRGAANGPGATRIGHNANDSMWPWNGITGGLRPSTAPRTPFPASALVAAPGATPTVGAMLDYQGLIAADRQLGFDYDDVPFDVPPIDPP